MIYNLETNSSDIIKVLDSSSIITAVNYGPYDNGHIMVGLADGSVLAFSYPKLERLVTI